MGITSWLFFKWRFRYRWARYNGAHGSTVQSATRLQNVGEANTGRSRPPRMYVPVIIISRHFRVHTSRYLEPVVTEMCLGSCSEPSLLLFPTKPESSCLQRPQTEEIQYTHLPLRVRFNGRTLLLNIIDGAIDGWVAVG